MTTESQLKPCPFCGGEGKDQHDDGYHWVKCIKCGATGPGGTKYSDEDDPEWNTRQEPSLEALKGEATYEGQTAKEWHDAWSRENDAWQAMVQHHEQLEDAARALTDLLERMRDSGSYPNPVELFEAREDVQNILAVKGSAPSAYESLKAENARLREAWGILKSSKSQCLFHCEDCHWLGNEYSAIWQEGVPEYPDDGSWHCPKCPGSDLSPYAREVEEVSASEFADILLTTPPTSWLSEKLRDVATRAAEAAFWKMNGLDTPDPRKIYITTDEMKVAAEEVVRGLNLEGE